MHQNQKIRIIIALAAIGVLFFASQFNVCTDYRPPLWALQLELSGKSAYGPEMQQRFEEHYPEPFASGGFGYPLPVMWLALPIVALPKAAIGPVWSIMGGGSVLLGLALLRMPIVLIFFLPLSLGLLMHQVTVLVTGLLLIGVWGWHTQRWWVVGAVVALTIGAKPQAALLVATTLAVLMLRAGAWKPLAVCGALVAVPTFALEPNWIGEWLAAVAQYREAIGLTYAFAWIPVAFVLLALRHWWGALAVFQISLFPTLFGYSLLPFLVGYVDTRSHRIALLAVICSWTSALLVGMEPRWLMPGVFYLTPLVVDAILRRTTRTASAHA